jgi:hypothetical protein
MQRLGEIGTDIGTFGIKVNECINGFLSEGKDVVEEYGELGAYIATYLLFVGRNKQEV